VDGSWQFKQWKWAADMNGEQMLPVEEFCYLILTNNGKCCKDVRTRIAKANLDSVDRTTFGVIETRTTNQDTAVLSYRESNPLILLYSAETSQTKTDLTSRGCTPQVAEKYSKRLMERYGSQRKYSGAN